jgi:hypothetical protein
MFDDVGYAMAQIFGAQNNDEFYYDFVQIMILYMSIQQESYLMSPG